MNNADTVYTDILIIGGGPSGLATSIHLADLLKKEGLNHRILLIEKGSSIGSHILSGAVIKADVFKSLLPDVDFNEIPFNAKVVEDSTLMLTEKGHIKLPVHVPYMNNKGNYTASLGQICRYLATKAEEKGVEIYTGFAVNEILYKDGKMFGVKNFYTCILPCYIAVCFKKAIDGSYTITAKGKTDVIRQSENWDRVGIGIYKISE